MDHSNQYFSYNVSISVKIESPSGTYLTTLCPYEIYIDFAVNRETVVALIVF